MLNLRNEAVDQAAHTLAAIAVLAPFAIAPCALAGAVSGFGIGLVRELTEEGEISLEALKAALGSRLDLAFWTLGGALLGLTA